jgi:hypothetical protein
MGFRHPSASLKGRLLKPRPSRLRSKSQSTSKATDRNVRPTRSRAPGLKPGFIVGLYAALKRRSSTLRRAVFRLQVKRNFKGGWPARAGVWIEWGSSELD